VKACNTDTTPTQPHRNSNTHRTKNNTTNVEIQQNNRQLLMMDILMSETCWAHKKWNKIASDIKLIFYSSTITMMYGPLYIRLWLFTFCLNYPASKSHLSCPTLRYSQFFPHRHYWVKFKNINAPLFFFLHLNKKMILGRLSDSGRQFYNVGSKQIHVAYFLFTF